MNDVYVAPAFKLGVFNCSHCRAYTKQTWSHLLHGQQGAFSDWEEWEVRFQISYCGNCGFPTIWHDEKMVFPLSSNAPMPNADLPDDVKADFEEARQIANSSPRGAAALLRLCVQKLCKHLGESGKDINNDIKKLVEKGLQVAVQQALDTVRVIGNNAVHPGEMDLQDNPDTVNALFKVVNFVAEKMISEKRQIDDMFSSLPQKSRDAITKRDGNK